jgi:hypothetical protein
MRAASHSADSFGTEKFDTPMLRTRPLSTWRVAATGRRYEEERRYEEGRRYEEERRCVTARHDSCSVTIDMRPCTISQVALKRTRTRQSGGRASSC